MTQTAAGQVGSQKGDWGDWRQQTLSDAREAVTRALGGAGVRKQDWARAADRSPAEVSRFLSGGMSTHEPSVLRMIRGWIRVMPEHVDLIEDLLVAIIRERSSGNEHLAE